MKKLKKVIIKSTLLIFMLILLVNQKTFATDNSNLLEKVEYSEDFKKWLELSDEERQNVMMPRMYEVPNTKVEYKNLLYKAKMLKASMNNKYNLKDIIPDNLAIRNQQQTNTCWAFARLSSLETNLALYNYRNGINLSKIYDFSERHMEYATSRFFANNVENPVGYNRTVGDGGTRLMADSYLANGYGAIPESEMPFENNENIIDISQVQNKTISTQLYDTVEFPDYNTKTGAEKTDIMNQIKQQIQNYGSIYAALHGNSSSTTDFSCYNNETGAKFCNNSDEHPANHAVSIIGWDDNYSIDNFAEGSKPTSNGAWIVRNSWGEKFEIATVEELKEEIFNSYEEECIEKGWNTASKIPNEFIEEAGYIIENDMVYEKYGDNGIIYVSYEDVNISKEMSGIVKATDTVEYENIYQYDELGYNTELAMNCSSIMLCNIFNKKTEGTEYLTQLLLYTPDTYTYKVYVNPNGTSKDKKDLQTVSLKAGESETLNPGYHTLEFSKPIAINADSFAVMVEIQSTTNQTSFALEGKSSISTTNLYSTVKTENEKCFVAAGNDLENCEWVDLGKLSEYGIGSVLPNGDSTIKAFTTNGLYDGSLKNIEIVTPPTKTSYFEGEDFDSTGMVVKANYNSKTDTSTILDSTSYTITDGTNLKAGQTSVTISYEDQTVKQTINVEKNSVVELKITTPPTKTEYKEGQNFDKTGMVVEATYKDGTTKIISDYTIENGNNLKADQTQVTIYYGEKTIEQPITVIPNPLMKIEITKAPNKTKYVVGENFDKTGMVVTGTYQDETTQEILDYTIENGNNLTKGQTDVTIKYGEKTAKQAITVEETAKNSNFDKANCDINNAKYYTFSNKDEQEYLVMSVTVNGITKNPENDSYEYYYYLSSNQDENNIENWVKIKEEQTSGNELKFEINTKDINNYEELSNATTLYLYIKEVAIKGEDQSVATSKAIKMDSDVTVETYLDNAKINNVNSSNQAEDTTVATNKLPNTGVKTALILMLIVLVVGIVVYIRYKNLSKYVK